MKRGKTYALLSPDFKCVCEVLDGKRAGVLMRPSKYASEHHLSFVLGYQSFFHHLRALSQYDFPEMYVHVYLSIRHVSILPLSHLGVITLGCHHAWVSIDRHIVRCHLIITFGCYSMFQCSLIKFRQVLRDGGEETISTANRRYLGQYILPLEKMAMDKC
jgi:hypothetical protein